MKPGKPYLRAEPGYNPLEPARPWMWALWRFVTPFEGLGLGQGYDGVILHDETLILNQRRKPRRRINS